MSCNRCADQAEIAMQTAGVPARQTQATWAQSGSSVPPGQCPQCGAFLTRQGRCVNSACSQDPGMQIDRKDFRDAGHNDLLPTLTSFDLDEMPPEMVRQIENELESMFKAGMNTLDRAFSQTQAMKAEFDAKHPGYKPEFVMEVGKARLTLLAPSGPPEADEAYRQWMVENKRLMKNAVLSMQGKWRHQLKHLFPLEADGLFVYKYRLIGTDITVSIDKETYKGQKSVFVCRGDEGLESFSTQMGKSGGWLESLRRLVERRLEDEDQGFLQTDTQPQ